MKDGMKIKRVIWTSTLAVLLNACLTSKQITIDNFHLYETPPNGIKISDNLFCDQTEMDNMGWMEYMYWNKKIFGSQSSEYISTLPDTLVWSDVDSCLNSYVESYLGHPAYRNYPVVGVSQKQAEEYSKWRSDRVFEYLLIKYKIIQYNANQTKENYFTIEKYFKGDLKNVISDHKVYYYPEFRLPTLSERQLILAYSDSLDKIYFENCNSRKCKCYDINYPKIWSDIIPCAKDTFKIDPTRRVHLNCPSEKIKPIVNLRGNVNEWTSEIYVAAGGGWRDNIVHILKSDTFNLANNNYSTGLGGMTRKNDDQTYIYGLNFTNAWTGFRNVCEWKRWKE